MIVVLFKKLYCWTFLIYMMTIIILVDKIFDHYLGYIFEVEFKVKRGGFFFFFCLSTLLQHIEVPQGRG